MAKLKVNERTVEGLQLEIDYHKQDKIDLRRENDSLRNDRTMLLDILEDLILDESYWSDDVNTKTMLFRLKNILNNLKNNQ